MPDRGAAPYYRPVRHELEAVLAACGASLPVLLKGPTGCGKSRLVEAVAAELGRPLVTLACNDETSAADLLGRWIVRGGDTEWHDGPATRAVRQGAVLYLDEIAEARDDVLVVLHPLADHRRELWVDRRSESLVAAPGFQAPCVVVSYTDDGEIQNGRKFMAEGMQIAAGVPLQCDEPADFKTFRIGLFGLDKLRNVERTVASFEQALDRIA